MPQSPSYRLTDEQWHAIEPHLPTSKGHRGGQYKDHRPMVEGILWVLADGGRWRNVPKEFGSWSSVFDRFRRWVRSGVWEDIWAALRDRKAEAGAIDAKLYSIDGSVVRAHVSAAGARKKNGRTGSRRTTRSGGARAASAPRST
jgi:transposase